MNLKELLIDIFDREVASREGQVWPCRNCRIGQTSKCAEYTLTKGRKEERLGSSFIPICSILHYITEELKPFCKEDEPINLVNEDNLIIRRVKVDNED